MRRLIRLIFAVLFISALALAQDKPRVFVQGKGSEDMTSSGTGGGGRYWGLGLEVRSVWSNV